MTEAIAATQGVYKSVNTRNTAAVKGVRISTAERIVSVLTTLSFAINPVMRAVEIFQLPNPSGTKSGASRLPTSARILSFESVTIFRCASKLCKNQIMIVARKMIVNARVRKSFALSQIRRPTLFALGKR